MTTNGFQALPFWDSAIEQIGDAMSTDVQQGVSAEAVGSISTPDRVESRLGRMDYVDGFPSRTTSEPCTTTSTSCTP